MFACQACAQRYIRALTSLHVDTLPLTLAATARHFPQPSLLRPARRNVSTPASESATYTPDQQPNVPPMSWKRRNAGLSGDDVVNWRDAPSIGDVQQARVDRAQEQKEKRERHEKRLEGHGVAREQREAKEVWDRERNGGRDAEEVRSRWRDSAANRANNMRRDVGVGKPELKESRSVNAHRRDRQAERRQGYTPNLRSNGQDSSAAEPKRQGWIAPEPRSTRLNERNLETELKYLRDPLKLADHVRYVLDQDDGDKAVALVRLSSKTAANTVSWNHVIDWQMKKGRTQAAITTYNEVCRKLPPHLRS